MSENRTKKILASLTLAGMAMSMTPFNAFADTRITTARLFGLDRVGTAVAVANAGWTTADTAILAPAADANLVDALAAAPLAGRSAPILLTDDNTLTDATKAELIKLGVKQVYVVGAINQTVVDQVSAMSGVNATVLKGADRIGTAAAISAKLTNPVGSFVVGYDALADALSVASYAAANNYSILVANPDGSLPVSEASYMSSNVYIIGGPNLVADIPGATRLFGADRFATNQAVLNAFTYTYNRVYVANGTDAHLVDSLVASSLAAESGAPIILADIDGNGAATANVASVQTKLAANAVVTALGGSTVVPDALIAQIANGAKVTLPAAPPVVGPVTINTLTIAGQLVGRGTLDSPAVALINNGVTVSTVATGASAVNANITYLVSTSNNITAKDADGNTLAATTLNSPIIIGNDTFGAAYTVPTDASGNVKAIFTSTASSQQVFNVVIQAPFSNNGQPVRSDEASIEWGVPGTTVLSPVYTASNPKGLSFSTAGEMKGLVPIVATILPATGSTTSVSGQSIKFKMTQNGGTSDANAYFTDSTGIPMVAAGAVVGNGGSSTSVIYVVNTDANGQALVYINSNLPTTNSLANPGAFMNVSLSAQLVNGGGSTNTGYYQWKAVAQAAKIGNVSPSAMLNPTGITSGTTLVARNAETATSGSQMTISGTLQDSAGNPVRNVTVAIQDYDVVNGFSNNVQNDAYVLNGITTLFSAVNYPTVITDSNGNFSVVVTADVPVTQSVLDSVTKYYAFYIPATIAVSTGQSLPANVTPLSFVGNSNSGDFINLVWQQGQTAQSVGVSHTSLLPNYATLSAVPQTYPFSNVVGSDEQIYAAAYNQNGMIIAPASGNQFDGYALTYDIIAPSSMFFDFLGSTALPTDPTHGGVGEMKVQYNQTGGFVINTLYYTDGTVCYSNGTLVTAASGPTGFDTNAYATAYDGSGQINFCLQSNNTSSVIASGTAGSVNVNINAYSNSATTIDTNHAQGSAAGMINAAFTASNSIGSLGVAPDLNWLSTYYPLLAGNAAPPSTLSVAGVAIPVTNIYDSTRNASFLVAPFNSYPAMGTIPSQGLTMNVSSTEHGVISNVDGYTLASMPSNVTINVNKAGEVSVNNVKLWLAQSGYQVVGYLPGSTSGSFTLIEQNLSNPTNLIGVNVSGVNSNGSQVATWNLPLTSLPGNFEGFIGFNVNSSGQLQPLVASYYKNNGNSFAPYSTDASTTSTGVFTPVQVFQVYASDKYSESPTITVKNSLNSQTATVTIGFTAPVGGLVAVQSNPFNINSVLGSSKKITLTAEDSYGNPIAYQTIFLGAGTAGLWLTQLNDTTIRGSVNLGTTSSTSFQTVDTPVPLFNVANAPAYDNVSVTGLTAYNLKSSPIVALKTGSDGTVSITLADGNVTYVANTASTTTSNGYAVDPGTLISSQALGLYSDAALTQKLGSVLVNWGSSGHSSSTTTLAQPTQPTLTAGIASWTAVANENNGYSVQLYKEGTASGAAVVLAHGATLSNDFSAAMTAGGSYTVTVKALGTGAYNNSVESSPSVAQVVTTTLAQPTQPTLVVGIARWTAVANENNGYSVQLYKEVTASGAAVVLAHGATLSNDFSAAMTAGGSYTVTVKALGTGAYNNSVESSPSVAQVVTTTLAQPTQPTLVAGIARWTAVANENNGYSVQLYKEGIASGAAVVLAHGATLSNDFSAAMTAGGSYTVTVKALGTGAYNNSVESSPSVAQVVTTQLTQPTQPTLTAGIASWTAVANENNGYSVQLYKEGIASGAAVVLAHGATLSNDFSAAMTAGGSYTVTVKALGTGAYNNSVESSPSVAQVVTTTLAQPTQPTLTAGIASWTAVANENNGYSVQLYKEGTASGAAVVLAHGATLSNDFSAAMTTGGSYTVTVKALGTGAYNNSVESSPSVAQVVFN